MASYTRNKTNFFGILNLTPDSFSDGGAFDSFERALEQARKLFEEGAFCIDIGGDSTRPGSICCGEKLEWERIGLVVKEVSKFSMVSVDTHHASVARLAIESGASIINDISSGSDPEMFSAVAESGKKIILTYTRCPRPHDFSQVPRGKVIKRISGFFSKVTAEARKAGLEDSQIILDPGMGAFISEESDDSWELLSGLSGLSKFKFQFMLSASRKGFLKSSAGEGPADRDLASAYVSALASMNCNFKIDFQRVHNVKLHRELFDSLGV